MTTTSGTDTPGATPGQARREPADRFTWIEVHSEQELHDWLLAHHDQGDAVWLVTWKKHVPQHHVTHEQVLDQLIAFGWTDGTARRIDDDRTRQLISPRRTKAWAKSYKDRAERLTATGRMHHAGQATIEHAQATGMWDAMNDVDALVVPDDLAAALTARPPADTNFAAFPASTRRSVLRWIATAKTTTTRTARITRTADEARRNVRVKSHG